ncbi:GTP-binding protein [Patescibacteria group bacterium]|nr:GTP-binding protein [Patescibacteria group bacterium]
MDTAKIRNIAVIAHVDHGKTTLVDSFIKQSHMVRENSQVMKDTLIMDKGDIEKERGITITAKTLYVQYKEYKINIIDTPGHADFSGEVERTLNMADGCLLIVDAAEGPMPQTRYVLKKALGLGKKIIVVINKIDKKFADIDKTLSKIYDLFLELAQNENQLDFPIFYAIAKKGIVLKDLPAIIDENSIKGDVEVLFESIINDIDPSISDIDKPFLMQVSAIDYDEYAGVGIVGKILQGTVNRGDSLELINKNNERIPFKVSKILTNNGLIKEEIESAISGDIVTIIEVKGAKIGDTITKTGMNNRIDSIEIQEPSITIKFEPSTSPLVGTEGTLVTSRHLLSRLEKEMEKNISMSLEVMGDTFNISGRGELHLSILIETLRREGYEFQISKPKAIEKIIDGKRFDTEEELYLDTSKDYIGVITTELAKRKAELLDMVTENDSHIHFKYRILTKNLFGLRGFLVNITKGTVVMHNSFLGYKEYSSPIKKERKGVLIATEAGIAKAYGLNKAQERGELFIGPGVRVYEGMIVGINKYDRDLEVNVVREKHLTNIHTEKSDENIILVPPIPMTIEFCMDLIEDDEYLEVTPLNLRLRKKYLKKSQRARFSKSNN